MLPQPADLPKSVLIVDQSEDARQVLRTVLARRGVQIWEASEGAAGLELARDVHPDLIILDAEGEQASDAICDAFANHASDDGTPLIFLGCLRRRQAAGRGDFVAKPYQYGPLIHKIEQLLTQAAGAHRRCA